MIDNTILAVGAGLGFEPVERVDDTRPCGVRISAT